MCGAETTGGLDGNLHHHHHHHHQKNRLTKTAYLPSLQSSVFRAADPRLSRENVSQEMEILYQWSLKRLFRRVACLSLGRHLWIHIGTGTQQRRDLWPNCVAECSVSRETTCIIAMSVLQMQPDTYVCDAQRLWFMCTRRRESCLLWSWSMKGVLHWTRLNCSVVEWQASRRNYTGRGLISALISW